MRTTWKLGTCLGLVVALESLLLIALTDGSGPAVPSLDGPENEEALRVATASIKSAPDNPVPYVQRARALAKRKLLDEALRDCDKAVELAPTSTWVRFNRGYVRDLMGDQERALSDYEIACRNESNLWAFNNRAWILSASPSNRLRNAALATKLARHACEISHWKEWNPLMTLAAALAEAGRFEEAVRLQRRVLALLPDADDEANRLAKRALELFSQRIPIRCFYENFVVKSN